MCALVRLSLWADGEVHASLSAAEVLYLTVGYDWLLFAHQLAERQRKGEEIFLFCYMFLEAITGPQHSADAIRASMGQQARNRAPAAPPRRPPVSLQSTPGAEAANADGWEQLHRSHSAGEIDRRKKAAPSETEEERERRQHRESLRSIATQASFSVEKGDSRGARLMEVRALFLQLYADSLALSADKSSHGRSGAANSTWLNKLIKKLS